MFKFIKKLLEPVDCYCRCHSIRYGKYEGSVSKGGSRQVSCKHCCNVKPKKNINYWGTKVPNKRR